MNQSFLDFKIIAKQHISDILAYCEGKNQKGIFIVFPEKEKQQRPFLDKILEAIRLDAQADILLLAGTPDMNFSVIDIKRHQPLNHVIVFGCPLQQIGLQIQMVKYKPYFTNNCHFLLADDLTDIAKNQALKGQLWKALKALFLNK